MKRCGCTCRTPSFCIALNSLPNIIRYEIVPVLKMIGQQQEVYTKVRQWPGEWVTAVTETPGYYEHLPCLVCASPQSFPDLIRRGLCLRPRCPHGVLLDIHIKTLELISASFHGWRRSASTLLVIPALCSCACRVLCVRYSRLPPDIVFARLPSATVAPARSARSYTSVII
jgi:hypothetical protein